MYDLFSELENKVISITGASGYIGSAIIRELETHSLKKIIRISRKQLVPKKNIEDWILDLKEKNIMVNNIEEISNL